MHHRSNKSIRPLTCHWPRIQQNNSFQAVIVFEIAFQLKCANSPFAAFLLSVVISDWSVSCSTECAYILLLYCTCLHILVLSRISLILLHELNRNIPLLTEISINCWNNTMLFFHNIMLLLSRSPCHWGSEDSRVQGQKVQTESFSVSVVFHTEYYRFSQGKPYKWPLEILPNFWCLFWFRQIMLKQNNYTFGDAVWL